MPRATKEEIFSTGTDPCAVLPLAADPAELEIRFGATTQLRKNSRQGFTRTNPAPHQSSAWSNSGKALGIEPVLLVEGVRSRSTGKERDSESNLDYFGARYNSSQYGRFMTPDPPDGPSPAPFAHFNDPQTLNLYAYVRNSPLTFADRDGHDRCSGAQADNADSCLQNKGQWIPGNVPGAIQSARQRQDLNDLAGLFTLGFWKPFRPRNPYEAGIMRGEAASNSFALFGIGEVELPGELADFAGLTRPVWADTPGGFVNWLKNLQSSGTPLTAGQADAIIGQAKELGVDVRLDPPHSGTNWDVPHLNIGRNGQVHLEVPKGYDNSSVLKGQ
jgi:RHS repeat-associated protein